MLGSSLRGRGFWSPDHHEVLELTILVGAGLLVGLVCVILMGRFSYKLSRDISAVAATAQRSADEQLPQLLERLRSGETAASVPEQPQSGPQPKERGDRPDPRGDRKPGTDRGRGGGPRSRAA